MVDCQQGRRETGREIFRLCWCELPARLNSLRNHVLHLCVEKRCGWEFLRGLHKRPQAKVEQHNRGLVESTKTRVPFKLIYYESCLEKHDAIRREKYLKTYNGRRFLHKRLKTYLTG